MKVLLIMMIFFVSALGRAQVDTSIMNLREFSQARELYQSGRFQKAFTEIERVEALRLNQGIYIQRPFILFWMALCLKKSQQYVSANEMFQKAKNAGYNSIDFEYEYAQSLYVVDEYDKAKENFTQSYKKNFKQAVSLYYLGTICLAQKKYDNAITYLNMISDLRGKEAEEVFQPAKVLIGDIYLEEADSVSNRAQYIKRTVIPKYETAIEVDENSKLAQGLRDKIVQLRRDNGLFLYELTNGRRTLIPRHLLTADAEMGYDNNVLFSPTETKIAKSKQGSIYSRFDAFARYAFYPKKRYIIMPEFRFNRTYYGHRVPEVYRNDNYFFAPALRTTLEHKVNNLPASFFLDYEYVESQRDVYAKQDLVFSTATHQFTVGERYQPFSFGELSIKFRVRYLNGYIHSSDSQSRGLTFDQTIHGSMGTSIITATYDQTRVSSDFYDTDVIALRGDFVFAKELVGFYPIVGFGYAFTDPINNRKIRGMEKMVNPTVRLNKSFGTQWRLGLKYDYQSNDSKDNVNFSFTKYILAANLNYTF